MTAVRANSPSLVSTRQCVILVGGKGTRLGQLAAAAPKPLMEVGGGDVFLDRLLLEIARHGFTDILLLAGHMAEQVSARYDGQTVRSSTVRVVVEPEPAGTAGALVHAQACLDDTFLFCNGDTLFDINYRRLDAALARHPDAAGVLALRQVPDGTRYGTVRLERERIIAFAEKAQSGEALIYGGVALLRREIIGGVVAPASIEVDVFPRLATERRLVGERFSGSFIDIGLPETLAEARRTMQTAPRRPAVFFDRDGVLNLDKGYTHRVEDLVWLPGAKEAVRLVNDAGALAIVVTNQAGVGRGYYSEGAVGDFHRAMMDDLSCDGAHVDAFYACFHHPDAALPHYRHPNHPDRKPNSGLIRRALDEWAINLDHSLLIGDQDSDIEAARGAGVAAKLCREGQIVDIVERFIDDL